MKKYPVPFGPGIFISAPASLSMLISSIKDWINCFSFQKTTPAQVPVSPTSRSVPKIFSRRLLNPAGLTKINLVSDKIVKY
jgi:hypothetical protein